MLKKITLIVALMFCMMTPVHAQKKALTLSVQATPLSLTKVKVTGKILYKNIKKADYYRIERAKSTKGYRLVKKGESLTYYDTHLAKNTRYRYQISAYYQGKKLSSASAQVYTGVGSASFFEYQRSDTKFTPTSIELKGFVEDGLKPTGYYVYRKNGKKYKRIANVKAKSKAFHYVDRKVVGGHGYTYKFAGYLKKGKTTYVGKTSSLVTMYACHAVGSFTSYVTKQENDYLLAINSDRFNGPMIMERKGVSLSCEEVPDLYFDSWSNDGRNFTTDSMMSLQPGKTLYLRLKSNSHQSLSLDLLHVDLLAYSTKSKYASLPAILNIPYDATGSARIDLEAIH